MTPWDTCRCCGHMRISHAREPQALGKHPCNYVSPKGDACACRNFAWSVMPFRESDRLLSRAPMEAKP